jgi:hypothetical protein
LDDINPRLKELCDKVAEERDPEKFEALLIELNTLLAEEKATRIQTVQRKLNGSA